MSNEKTTKELKASAYAAIAGIKDEKLKQSILDALTALKIKEHSQREFTGPAEMKVDLEKIIDKYGEAMVTNFKRASTCDDATASYNFTKGHVVVRVCIVPQHYDELNINYNLTKAAKAKK